MIEWGGNVYSFNFRHYPEFFLLLKDLFKLVFIKEVEHLFLIGLNKD